ncbi:MAG: ABC transporter permease [Anaerolineaceae bacterium]|nr:ABC transporter permease [Anaerolineaceae bacterium]
MVFRYSILSILRSKAKTALFTLLLFTLTLALSLGVSVWASVAQFLNECDEYYTTIGMIEYMGTSHPDDLIYDEAMANALSTFDPSFIQQDESTLFWNAPTRSLGYVDGFWRTDDYVPGRMLSVLVVGNVGYSEKNRVYSGIVMNTIYSLKSENDTIILIDEDFGSFEPDRYYLVFGEVFYGSSPLLHLRRANFDNAISSAQGIEVPHMLDITADAKTGQFYTIPENSIFLQVADTLRVVNNSLLVSGTEDLFSLLPFHQQELYLIDGRAFTEEEYNNGSPVIILSELVSNRLGVYVGDTIDLSLAVSDYPGIYNSYWVSDGFTSQSKFKIVGITNTVNDKSWYAFVPKTKDLPASKFPIGYTVGQAIVQNEDAAEFYNRVEPTLSDRFHLTIYDQGYSTVAIPYQTILIVAKIVTLVCLLLELAVLILFGFLFVYRQRETSETMQMLGAGKKRVIGHFLFSAGIIAFFSTMTGAIAAFLLHDRIMALVVKAADHYALIDARFSNGNLTTSRVLEFSPALKLPLFLSIGGVVFLLALSACLVFVLRTFLRIKPTRPKTKSPKKIGKTSRLNGGSLKYAILSIIRGGARSFIVPLLAVAIVIFFGQLSSTVLRYQEQLDTIYNNSTIQGYFTDINGKKTGNQVLSAYDITNLYNTGQVNSLSISIDEPYYFLGIKRWANGREQNLTPLFVPDNHFVYESLQETIQRGADLTATNNINTAPEFFYSNQVNINFMDGYDESVLEVPYQNENSFTCILPTSLMKKHEINLGDTVRFAINDVFFDPTYDERVFVHYDLLVIGSYEKQGAEDTIYVPLSLFTDTGLIWGKGQSAANSPTGIKTADFTLSQEEKDQLQATTFQSANFNLTDARMLSDFKNYLTDYGFSQVHKVGSVRQFIVLKDAEFNAAVASVKQQILYINTLYPFLYFLVGTIALVVSYLIVVSRKKEFATMRGLGSTRANSFFSFFFEQGILIFFGTAFGLMIWYILFDAVTIPHRILIAGFLICYFIGCTISIRIMNNANVLTILGDRD